MNPAFDAAMKLYLRRTLVRSDYLLSFYYGVEYTIVKFLFS